MINANKSNELGMTMQDTNKTKIVLGGDIGGTKTDLGLFKIGQKRPEMIVMESFQSRHARNLSEIIESFLAKNPENVKAACFGVAGPVIAGKCKITNLAWDVSEQEIKSNFKWKKTKLINDLFAMANSIQLLEPSELFPINPGCQDQNGNAGLVAPGTGLGMSLLVPTNESLRPIASEGGHAGFAPRNEIEIDLWRYMRAVYGRVSTERLVSGPGIYSIYKWLKKNRQYEEPDWLTQKISTGDPTAVISEAALKEEDPLCMETLNIFVSIFGAVCGDLALVGMTTRGIYLGGGIPPKILPKLKEGQFMEAFCDKGRFRDVVSKIPVYVIMNTNSAMLGAAACAFEL